MVFAFLGTPEIIIILVLALLVFGPEKLPQIGKQVGTAMRELNKVRNDVQKALEFDEFANLGNLDSYTSPHDSYDNSYHTMDAAGDSDNGMLPYQSPQGVTHAISASDEYSVTDPYTGEEAEQSGIMHEDGTHDGEPLPHAAQIYHTEGTENTLAVSATPPGPIALSGLAHVPQETAQQGTV